MNALRKIVSEEFFQSVSKKHVFITLSFLLFIGGLFFAAGRHLLGLGVLGLGTALYLYEPGFFSSHRFALFFQNKKAGYRYTVLLLGIFYVYMIISGFWATDTGAYIATVGTYTLFLGIVYATSLQEKNTQLYTLKGVVSMSTALSLYGLYQYFIASGSGLIRIEGLFLYANTSALVSLIGLLAAVFFLVKGSSIGNRVFWGVSAYINYLALVFSFSRGGWLVALIGLAMTLFIYRKTFFQKKYIASILAGVCVLFVSTYALMSLRKAISESKGQDISFVRTTETQSENGFSYRLEYWKEASRILKRHPFGVGAGNYEDTIRREQSSPLFFALDPHSFIVRMSVEYGVGALFFFAVLLCVLYFTIKNTYRSKKQDTYHYVILLTSFLFLLHSAIDAHFRYPFIWIIFGIFFGILLSFSSLESADLAERDIPERSNAYFRYTSYVGTVFYSALVLGSLWIFSVGYFSFMAGGLEGEKGMHTVRAEYTKKAASLGHFFGDLWLDSAYADFYVQEARSAAGEKEIEYSMVKKDLALATKYKSKFYAIDRAQMVLANKERDYQGYIQAGENARLHNPYESLMEQASLVSLYLSQKQEEKGLSLAKEMYENMVPYFQSEQFKGDINSKQKFVSVAQAQGYVYMYAKATKNTQLFTELESRVKVLTEISQTFKK